MTLHWLLRIRRSNYLRATSMTGLSVERGGERIKTCSNESPLCLAIIKARALPVLFPAHPYVSQTNAHLAACIQICIGPALTELLDENAGNGFEAPLAKNVLTKLHAWILIV